MITVPRQFVEDFDFVMAHYGESPEEWKDWARDYLAEAIEKFAEWRKWIEAGCPA